MIIPWLNENIRDFKKRSVNIQENPKNGIILILIGEQISLFKSRDGAVELIKEDVIDYNKIAKERSIEQRLKIVMESMQDVNEFFLVEESLVHKILYGFTK